MPHERTQSAQGWRARPVGLTTAVPAGVGWTASAAPAQVAEHTLRNLGLPALPVVGESAQALLARLAQHADAQELLERSMLEAVASLAKAVEARDRYTGGHCERVGWLAGLAGRALGLPPDELQMLEWAGLLHDIGKIGVPEEVLNKPGPLTDAEFAIIKRHPRMGYEVLRPLSGLGPVLDAVLYHHENHDGSGYPEGLAGMRIPPSARILHVVDIFDALTSTRSYRRGVSVDEAVGVLRAGSGTVTEPRVTAAFVRALERLMREQPAAFCRRFAHLSPPEAVAGPNER